MIEIPESKAISQQADGVLVGRVIRKVLNATSPHRFTWYVGDPVAYSDLLIGKRIESVKGYGAYVDVLLEGGTHLAIGDGTHMRYYPASEQHPDKYQLLVGLDDGSVLVFTVAMYGAIYAFEGYYDNAYYQGSVKKLSPLEDRFDETCFEGIFKSVTKDISVKALLATEQRIPGLGNGVLQDILFYAGINPRRKISTLGDLEKGDLFYSVKNTLVQMADQGGRDTEKDFFGNWGSYRTVLSKNTYRKGCPNCGTALIKEAYLGGAVYYCPVCQRIR